ncbi:MAG TPA: hypothetical protein VJH22_06955 [Candidatus Nanoarchaeia archaeon]|nr:hypothetical protein [Candidatus Nanoarchaeia archaeon]
MVYGMMGNCPWGGYGATGVFGSILVWAVLIGIVALVWLWVVKLYRDVSAKRHK